MKIFVETIRIKGRTFSLYISDEPLREQQNEIILTKRDLDRRWIESICKNSDGHICDEKNRFFLLLYWVYSFSRKSFFEDSIMLYGDWENIPRGRLLDRYYKEILKDFMKENGYKFTIFKDHRRLYFEKYIIPYHVFSIKEYFSPTGLYVLWRIGYYSALYANICARLLFARLSVSTAKLPKGWKYQRIKTNGKSGNKFYRTIDKNNKEYIVKCGKYLDDEYDLARFLAKKTTHPEYYVLPHEEMSSKKVLFYDYIDGEGLDELISKRQLSKNELYILKEFLKNILDDLQRAGVLHCDIQPSNIIAIKGDGKEIVSYKLLDFGCARIKKEKDSNRKESLMKKYENQHKGSTFRAGKHRVDDVASALYLLLQIDANELSIEEIGTGYEPT